MEASSQPSSVGRKATSGIAWLMGQSIGGRVALLVSQLILAKILLPEDFGILGLASTITAVFGVMTNVGIDQVLQQRRFKMKFWATQAFWISLAIGSATALAMAIYAPIGARLYHNEKVTQLVWITASSLPIASLAVVPQAQLQSLMRFKFLAFYNTAELVSVQALTIGFALCHFGAISFVLPVPMLALVRAIVFWRVAPLPLRSIRLTRGWGHMLRRGGVVFGSRLAITLVDQGDYITLGFFTSAQVLGYYYFAFKLAAQPVRMLAGSFSNVLFPVLTSLHDEPERQLNAAMKTAEVLGALTVPVCFLQAAVAGPGLALLFGARWEHSILFIQILSIGLAFDAIAWSAGAFLSATGQFKRMSTYCVFQCLFFYFMVISGAVIANATGVAMAVAIYYVIHTMVFSMFVFCREGISARRVVASCLWPVLIGGVTIGGAYALSQLLVFSGLLVVQIAVTTVLGITAYIFAVRQFLPDIYANLSRHALGILKK